MGFSLAEGEWGDIATDDNSTIIEEDVEISQEFDQPIINKPKGEAVTVYTNNFYIALGLGAFAILLVLYIFYLFVRGPKERWKKQRN